MKLTHFMRSLAAVAAVCLPAGCGPVERRVPPATGPSSAQPAPLDAASLAAADLERGELLGLACRACHTFAPGGEHEIGPNLYGVFGSPAAARDDFVYSPALESTSIVWSPATLDRWLSNPTEFVSGSTMTFAGYADPIDRRDLIAYLLAALGGSAAGPPARQ